MVTSQMVAMRKIVLKVVQKSQVNTEAALFQIIHRT